MCLRRIVDVGVFVCEWFGLWLGGGGWVVVWCGVWWIWCVGLLLFGVGVWCVVVCCVLWVVWMW